MDIEVNFFHNRPLQYHDQPSNMHIYIQALTKAGLCRRDESPTDHPSQS